MTQTSTITAERRREEKAQRRSDIIDAAERVIERKGYDKATMGDIAKEARLSRALIYFYFDDKAAIDLAIAQRAIDLLYKLFEQAVETSSVGAQKIQAIGLAYIHFYKTYPFYFEQFARYEAKEVAWDAEADSAEKAYVGCGQRLLGLMAMVIQQGIEDGSIRSDIGDPMQTAITLWGMTHGVLQLGGMKADMLAHKFGLTVDMLAAHTIDMAGHALVPAGQSKKP